MYEIISGNVADSLVDLSKWTQNSSISSSIISGWLEVSVVGVNYDLVQKISLINRYINCQNITCEFKYKKIDTLNSEFLIGFDSINTFSELTAVLKIKNIGDQTLFYIKRMGFDTDERLLLSCFAELNDVLKITFTFNNQTFKMSVLSPTQSTPIYSNSISVAFNTSQFVISPAVGSHQIKDLILYSNYPARPPIKFIGDSITARTDSYSRIVGSSRNSYAIFAGSGDRTEEVISGLADSMISIGGCTTVLIGTNNRADNMLPITFRENLKIIYDRLSLQGEVFVSELICNNSYSVRAYNTEIYNIIPVDKIIPSFSVLKQTGNDNFVPAYTVDGTHPSAAGSKVLANFWNSWLNVNGY